jgi:hypothetical protein
MLGFSIPVISMVSETSRDKRETVRMFHCTCKEIAEIILIDGLKSRAQLAKEGKAEIGDFRPTSNHYESVFFQWKNPARLRKVKSGLWYNLDESFFNYCVAIEVDPNTTMVYNPNLRMRDAFELNRDYYSNIEKREETYSQSGMLLKKYIEKDKRSSQMICIDGGRVYRHPFTADPVCLPINSVDWTEFNWNEHTIQRDRIDPSEFAQ